MIEIVPEKPEITDELAMSLRELMSQYTTGRDCSDCVYREDCVVDFNSCPANWG